MRHEVFEKTVEIVDSDITFDKIYKKEYIPQEHISDIMKANILIIPYETYKEEKEVCFPETTIEFYDFIKANSNDEIILDIAISDDKFQRLELHSATINVATVLVTYIALPIATSMIASFLYDLVKKYRRNNEETSAEVSVIVEETKTKKSKKIMYKGPVSGVKEALDEAAKNLFAGE